MIYAGISGVGGHLPARVVDNEALSKFVDTSDEWVQARTGIKQRYLAGDNDLASDLALPAAKQAMAQAGIDGSEVDMIIFATTTPDRIYPATACLLQTALGAAPCAAFDVQAVCSGFLYALGVGESFIVAGRAKTVLVVGAEVFSSTLDWQDRATCVLFGDGAGAAVLRASSTPGIIASCLYADGRYADKLTVNARIRNGRLLGDAYTRMDGGTVFRFAVDRMVSAARTVMEQSGMAADWLVLHQANSRIIEAVRKKLAIAPERCINCVADYANTSAASIPLALAQSAANFARGDTVLMAAVGGGFTWGATLMRWQI